jgi:hypothetical protein
MVQERQYWASVLSIDGIVWQRQYWARAKSLVSKSLEYWIGCVVRVILSIDLISQTQTIFPADASFGTQVNLLSQLICYSGGGGEDGYNNLLSQLTCYSGGGGGDGYNNLLSQLICYSGGKDSSEQETRVLTRFRRHKRYSPAAAWVDWQLAIANYQSYRRKRRGDSIEQEQNQYWARAKSVLSKSRESGGFCVVWVARWIRWMAQMVCVVWVARWIRW